jgi:predicted TIM-barrel fold metal-dependent hydrolase
MAGDETAELIELLREQGVTQAWAGSFDALLHKDIAAVNSRLADQCRGNKMLAPFGAINPMLPDWEEDLRRCHEEFKMRGIRLHPNYHGYALDHPNFVRLLRLARERGLIVQIVVWMEDQRCADPLLRVADVDLALLPAALEAVREVKVMVLNGSLGTEPPVTLLKTFDNVSVDFARMDGLAELGNMVHVMGLERVVFGSYSPMFYLESAELKVREAGLVAGQTAAILSGNARSLFGGV